MRESPPLIIRPPAGRPTRERVLTALFLALRAITSRLQRRPTLPADPCRVLVIKPCCLGDVLLTTPAIAALRTRYPRSVLQYAVGQYAAAAIAGHPQVNRVLNAGPGAGHGLRALPALWRRMHAGRYDLCVVLDRSPLLTTLPFLAGIPVRAGIDSSGRGFALNVRVPWDESLHEADLYLSVAAALGCPVQGHRLRFLPGMQAVRRVDELLRAQDPAEPLVVIAPGGGTNPGMDLPEKRWLPERFAALADRLHADTGASIVLLGGPADRLLCVQVQQAMRAPGVDLSGAAAFAERGALLQRASLFVGNDSGPMHLAVATGCPVVAIFGPTSPALYGPYSARARVVRLDLACSPCFVHGHFPPCPNQHACMQGLEVEEVYRACLALMEDTGRPSAGHPHGAPQIARHNGHARPPLSGPGTKNGGRPG